MCIRDRDRTGGDPITQGNRNPLLYKNLGADGIKTGYLAVEKYSLASSIDRNGRRLIAVGSGFNSKNSRSKELQYYKIIIPKKFSMKKSPIFQFIQLL